MIDLIAFLDVLLAFLTWIDRKKYDLVNRVQLQ